MIREGRRQIGPNTSYPASQALKSFEERLPYPEYQKRNKSMNTQRGCDEKTAVFSKKRRIHFEMNDMIAVIKPVEDSIAFPVIEWAYDEEDLVMSGNVHSDESNIRFGAPYSSFEGLEREAFATIQSSNDLDFRLGKGLGVGNLVLVKSNAFHLVSLAPFVNTTLSSFPNCFAAMETTKSMPSVLPLKQTQENEDAQISVPLPLSHMH